MEDIVHVFICDCRPGFNWKNKNTYNIHFKTNRHRVYELELMKKTHNIEINKLQLKLNQLRIRYNELLSAYHSACNFILTPGRFRMPNSDKKDN